MIALKKLYGEELLRLALMLSLLRAGPDQYLRDEARILAGGLVNGTDWAPEMASIHTRTRFLHPKSLDSILLDYERDVFEELHTLGRWGNAGATREAVQAYLLNGVENNNGQATANIEQNNADDQMAHYQHLANNQLENEDVEEFVTIKTEEQDEEEDDSSVSRMHATRNPDTTITLSASFIRNLTSIQGPLLEEDSAQSVPFDVSQFFSNPTVIKREIKTEENSSTTPIETGTFLDNRPTPKTEDFADDNAIDDYIPFYMQGGGDSITDQNLADLEDFAETAETLEEFKRNIEFLDVKQSQENLDRYLIENTDLDLDEANACCFVKRERASTSFTSVGSSSGVSDEAYASSSCSNETQIRDIKCERDEGLYSGDELTQEDMDLIEVLWKQDVDMGFCLDKPAVPVDPTKCVLPSTQSFGSSVTPLQTPCTLATLGKADLDEIDRLKDELKLECEAKAGKPTSSDDVPEDPWAGLDYTVDTETGEYVLSAELPGSERLNNLLEEALQLVGIEDTPQLEDVKSGEQQTEGETSVEDDEAGAMLAGRYAPSGAAHAHHHHLAQHHHSQHHHHQQLAAAYHHQNLVRSMSMEQRWQDLATLLALPAQHHHHQQHQQHQHHLQQQQQHMQHDQHDLYQSLGHGAEMSPGYAVPPYAPLTAEKPVIPSTADLYGAGANLGSAVAASMNIPHGPSAGGPGPPPPSPPFYKAEHGPQHDQDHMYYQQNTTTELNGTQDGFLSSILNDEDLQLMDMAMNEGMYTMRMLDQPHQQAPQQQAAPLHPPVHPHHQSHLLHHQLASMNNNTGSERIDASSDSAVSSMGSERVPSLSDSEWCDGGSDSAQDYHTKMRPCEDSRQQPLVAQKKHHMFGKRCFQEQPPSVIRPRPSDPEALPPPLKFEYEHAPPLQQAGYAPDVGHLTPEMKYSCTMEFNSGLGPPGGAARHNHTYSLPPAPPLAPHRPLVRDKRGRRGLDGQGSCSGSGPMSRDEKRARQLGIPMSVHDIINLPMDEFNERLSKHDLSETQLSLIRDIRRRGKNKVAAQNCRKRKLDQITSLADEVRDVRSRKQRLHRDHQMLTSERQRTKEHFAALYRHVFQHLRDSDGNPLSSQQFSLQQAADGAVVLVPRAPASRNSDRHMSSSNGTSEDELERIKIKQRKSFDQ